MKVFVVLSLVAFAAAAPSVMDNSVSSGDGFLDITTKMFASCADSNDKVTCFALKGVNALNRAARAQNLEVLPGVTFVRDPNAPVARNGKSLTETDVAGDDKLVEASLDAASNFMKTHTLEVKFPKEMTAGFARSIEEGRGKVKKMMGPLALAIGAKLVAMIPIFLGGLVLLATKALVVAKIAFVLAASLAAQKFIGAGGSGFNLLSKFAGAGAGAGTGSVAQGWASTGNQAGWSTGGAATQGWSSGAASAQYPYARSYDAQEIAYNGQAPAATTQ